MTAIDSSWIGEEQHIQYTFMNMMRMNPEDYVTYFEVHFACETFILEPLLLETNDLKKASDAELSYLLDSDCPFSHMTCEKYCHIYESCSLESRVKYYCPICQSIGENIMRGPKSALHSIHLFMEQPGHCANIFDFHHNVVAFSFHSLPNIFVQTFAYIPNQYPSNPFVGGCFIYEDETSVSFYVNYLGNSTVFVVIDHKKVYEMKLFLGYSSYTCNVMDALDINFTYYFSDSI